MENKSGISTLVSGGGAKLVRVELRADWASGGGLDKLVRLSHGAEEMAGKF